MKAAALAALVACVLHAAEAAKAAAATSHRALERDVAVGASGERPVAKVVRMLQDIEAELEKEMADDKAVYSMLTCWCTKNDEEKTKAIEVATANIAQLEASLSAAAAKVKELKAKRKATMDEMYAGQKALGEAQQIRMEENKAFHSEETDLLEAVAACKGALVALGKHHADLAQVQAVARSLRRARVEELALGPGMSTRVGPTLARARTQALKNFLDAATTGPAAPSGAFMAIPGMQSYAPQSGQIFGILKQMKADFESSLSEAQKAELKAAQEFEDLKAAKLEEISAAKKLVEDIDVQVAQLGEKAAQETKELEATEEQLGMDQQFLADLKAKCSESDKEFDTRIASRLDEISAVQDAIKILNSDESFKMFLKTTKGFVEDQQFVEQSSAFVQTGAASKEAGRRARVADLLRKAAGHTGSPRLALVAASAQIDSFTKVKEIIDKLVAELQVQMSDEVKHRDWCIDEFAVNKEETQAADHKMSNLQQKKTDLETNIEKLTAKIAELTAEMASTQDEMGRASDNRESENAELTETIEDQRLAQIILAKALARMKEVYAFLQQQPGAAHIATSGNHTNAGNGPAAFTKYAQNTGGSRVVDLLENVIADSQKLEDEAMTRSISSQTEYEDFMKSSNAALRQMAKTKAGFEEALATAKEDLVATKADIMETLKVLEGLHGYKGDLHKSCDYILKNFEARQQARQAEIEALGEAKAILSGAK